jgi:hypothetical protein
MMTASRALKVKRKDVNCKLHSGKQTSFFWVVDAFFQSSDKRVRSLEIFMIDISWNKSNQRSVVLAFLRDAFGLEKNRCSGFQDWRSCVKSNERRHLNIGACCMEL